MAHRDESEWLTLGQAARFLGVAQSTIRKWSDNGRVPAFYTPGGHRRYRRSDDSSMYLCAPKEQFLAHNCGGDAEGKFGDAVADFPVR